MAKIDVNGVAVTVVKVGSEDYISLTDMMRSKDGEFFFHNWLRNRNTVEFLGTWEKVFNPEFNSAEFDIIKSKAGLNNFRLSAKEWTEKTHAIGIVSKAGRYGGTYAHKDIAFEFAMWISPEPIPEPPSDDTLVGDYVVFGSYEQDNDTSNGAEPIEWLVLDKQDGRLLVISRYVLDYRQYHGKIESVTWETCALHKWLNEEFLKKAFIADDRSAIRSTTINTEGSKDTKDKIFLLSTSEAREYLDSTARQCMATAYARAQGSSERFWWLRSPGSASDFAGYVYSDGDISEGGDSASNYRGVRPALWINIG